MPQTVTFKYAIGERVVLKSQPEREMVIATRCDTVTGNRYRETWRGGFPCTNAAEDELAPPPKFKVGDRVKYASLEASFAIASIKWKDDGWTYSGSGELGIYSDQQERYLHKYEPPAAPKTGTCTIDLACRFAVGQSVRILATQQPTRVVKVIFDKSGVSYEVERFRGGLVVGEDELEAA